MQTGQSDWRGGVSNIQRICQMARTLDSYHFLRWNYVIAGADRLMTHRWCEWVQRGKWPDLLFVIT